MPLLPVLAALLVGCGFEFPTLPPLNLPPAGRDFVTAPVLELDETGAARFRGTAGPNLIAVFDLGAMSPGDRINVTVDPATASLLDPLTALFDEREDLFARNDDRNFLSASIGSFISENIRSSTQHMYLAITASYFSSQRGDFNASVQVVRGQQAPTPRRQVVYLDFVGGSHITVPNVGTFDFVPFDAARIDPAYAGHTDEIRAGIVAIVRAKYAAYNVDVLSSDDGLPSTSQYSSIYFGNYSRTTFGISQQVDTWNADCCDDGIIFTDRYDDAFAVQPNVAQIAVGIANVAAHEAGHLLGLSHVADITDLMDTTGAASTLLGNQIFKRSVLDRSVFPIGYQDGPKTLYATVGAR